MIMEEERMIESLPSEEEKKDDHLKSMDEVRQENQRLKFAISQILKNYRSLKVHFQDIVQQDQPQKSTDLAASDGESDLVSLSLGRFSCDHKRDQKKNSYKNKHQRERELDGLELGLDCKFHSIEDSKNLSPENSSDESKEEDNNVSQKGSKTARSGDDEILEQNPLKKPRVCIRLVCNTQTMNDGCQWRKYGQKVAKGNPCPRAYYRCTLSSSCPVRKQVQRCAQDMSILNTTYEGTHNHPLPPSAASMASATSAAAAMLNCGSSTSPPLHGGSATSSTTPNLLTFNFPSSNPLTARTSISTSQSHPTVILDLTAPNHTSPPYNYSSSSLFSTSTPNPQLSIYDKLIHASQQGIVSDRIAAATKAITGNPTFQSALAAAITSFVGNGSITNLDQERKSFEWGANISFSQPFMASGVSRAI